MEALYNIDLKPLIEEFNISVLIETGTGQAVSLLDSLKYGLDQYYSIEIHPQVYKELFLRNTFPDNVKILNTDSVSGLKQILAELPEDVNVCFFLDGHFANGSDFHLGSYADCRDNKELNLPLESELRLIKELRPNNRDVILCDDVRIYMDGPWEGGGNWIHREMINAGTIDFAYEIFSDRRFELSYKDQGYLFILPKN